MQTYDYIVVGAGSAGAAVANRLSADPRNKVLLLEAGRASHPWSSIPIGMARLITNPAANWLYSSEPEASTNGRRLPVPRGKLLGGSSSINGMVFVRGQAQDFDTWAQMGNRGWSYTEVLPFFKRMESYAGGGDDGFRGREGPLRVTNPEPRDLLFATIIKAAAQVGIRHNPDYNGASQAGIAMSQATIAGGRRMSTAAVVECDPPCQSKAACLRAPYAPWHAMTGMEQSSAFVEGCVSDGCAVRIARAIMTAPAMTPFQMSEFAPGADRTTDDEILDWVKLAAETTYHPVGTCKMGSDPMAVVDAQLRLHGIAGLRVADASIMPTLTSGNTNAPSIMIGEKAADMVLNAAI